MTDASGLVPNSKKWYAYWKDQFDKYRFGDSSVDLRGMPLGVFRMNLRNCDDTE